jgi:response regulator NasT
MKLRVLVVESGSGHSPRLKNALGEAGFHVLEVIRDSQDLQAAVESHKPDAIIIDADSPSRDTLEHLAAINERFPKPMVMLTDRTDIAMVRAAAQAGVSAYAVDRLTPQHLRSLLDVAIAHFHGRSVLQAELQKTQQTLEERRIIDRAKCLLMERKGLREEESYAMLRRLAMSRGQRIVDIARIFLQKPDIV